MVRYSPRWVPRRCGSQAGGVCRACRRRRIDRRVPGPRPRRLVPDAGENLCPFAASSAPTAALVQGSRLRRDRITDHPNPGGRPCVAMVRQCRSLDVNSWPRQLPPPGSPPSAAAPRTPTWSAVTGRWDQPRHPVGLLHRAVPTPMDIRSAGHLGVVRYVSDRRPGAEFMKAAADRTGIGGHASHRTGRRLPATSTGRERPPIGSVVSTRRPTCQARSELHNLAGGPADAPIYARRSTTNPPPTSSPARSRPASRAGSR